MTDAPEILQTGGTAMAIPTKDSALVAWSTNFDEKIAASAVTYSLTPAQATSYHTKHVLFLAAYNTLIAAREEGTRSKSQTMAKDEAKTDLLTLGRQLYVIAQSSSVATPIQKTEAGIHLRDTQPTPVPAPNAAPALAVTRVFGHDISISLKDASGARKGRPIGVAGASLFTFVGETAPATTDAGWKAEGNVTRNRVIVQFPESVAPGSKVWFTAFWYNPRGLAGPACTPVGSGIGYEGAMPLAA
jgi:hypothetical protein